MEFLLEFDIITIRNAIWAGYILSLFLPAAAVYLFYRYESSVSYKDEAAFLNHQRKLAIQIPAETCGSITRIFYPAVRRKEAPDDSDGPSLSQLSSCI